MIISLAQLNKQIAKLEKQAQAIKRKDAPWRHRPHQRSHANYDLTPEDLGVGRGASAKHPKASSATKRTPKSKAQGKYKTGISTATIKVTS